MDSAILVNVVKWRVERERTRDWHLVVYRGDSMFAFPRGNIADTSES